MRYVEKGQKLYYMRVNGMVWDARVGRLEHQSVAGFPFHPCMLYVHF